MARKKATQIETASGEEVEEKEEIKEPLFAEGTLVSSDFPPPTLDPVTLRANQILGHITNDMAYDGIRLDLNNKLHLIVAAWLVGRGGWLRK